MEGNSCTKICRFCLETCNSNFETIDEVTFANLDILWLKLNLTISEKPVMCRNCGVTIRTSSNFKIKCLENCVVPYVKDKDSIKIDLRVVYVSNTCVENIGNVPEDHIVCRLCLELVKNDSPIFLRNSTDIVEKLEQYFPELDLTCTDDPVICGTCQDSLQCYFSFIYTCLTTEEKITEYCKVVGINGMGQIDLNNLIHFILSKDFLKCEFEVGTVKIEGTCSEDSENTNNHVKMKKEENLEMELDMKKDRCAQKSELTDKIRFQHHSSSSHSDGVSQLTGVQPAKYTCEICGKRKHDLQVHRVIYKDDTKVTMYKCDLCDYKTKRKPDLKRHMLTHKTDSEIIMYKCDLCDFQTKRKFDQNRHMLTHKTHSEITMYKCDLCHYKAKKKYMLKRHMLTHKTHSEIFTYKCDLCDYEARLKAHLKGHMLTHKSHLETIIYKCDLCDYVSKWEKNIKSHMLTHKTPSEITMYKCDLCDYQTKWNILKRHMLTHSKTSMYKCDLCNYQTKWKAGLKKHLLTHRSPSEITMYKCEMCDHETKRKACLKRHMLTHRSPSEITMYKCEMCDHKTKRKSDLKKHVLTHKTHTEISMYKCKT